ncbi:MAG: HD domain-containing protein [Planctomycetes bacterium]|nr:HD domain-containing protein [Planctomycetota bacterium]
MKTPKIGELKEGIQFEGFYAVRDANLLTTSSGKPYIRMSLGDSTGNVSANMWDASQEIFNSFAVGGVVKVRAMVETYRGNIQLKISAIRPAHDSEYDKSSFIATTGADVDELKKELFALIDSIGDKDYRALMKAFFDDASILDKFAIAPAAKENHHAYIGGLLEHTMSLAKICDVFCKTTSTQLNRDLLICGALLHDIGKITELGATTAIEYTDAGKLLGHLVIGTMMVEDKARDLGDFPEIKKWLVMHMILSHHGKREYGSPVLPAIPEALALHHIDNLDAKTVAARRMIDADAENEREWTERSWMLETQLYKGSLGYAPAPASDKKDKQEAEEEITIEDLGSKVSKPRTGSLF